MCHRLKFLEDSLTTKRSSNPFSQTSTSSPSTSKPWHLTMLATLFQASEHLKTHRYSYSLLLLTLLVFAYRREPALFKRALKYLGHLI